MSGFVDRLNDSWEAIPISRLCWFIAGNLFVSLLFMVMDVVSDFRSPALETYWPPDGGKIQVHEEYANGWECLYGSEQLGMIRGVPSVWVVCRRGNMVVEGIGVRGDRLP